MEECEEPYWRQLSKARRGVESQVRLRDHQLEPPRAFRSNEDRQEDRGDMRKAHWRSVRVREEEMRRRELEGAACGDYFEMRFLQGGRIVWNRGNLKEKKTGNVWSVGWLDDQIGDRRSSSRRSCDSEHVNLEGGNVKYMGATKPPPAATRTAFESRLESDRARTDDDICRKGRSERLTLKRAVSSMELLLQATIKDLFEDAVNKNLREHEAREIIR